MRLRAGRAVGLAAALAALSATPAAALPEPPKRAAPRTAADSLLLAAADRGRADGVLRRFGAGVEGRVAGTRFVRVAAPRRNAARLLRALNSLDAVPDYVRRAAAAPADPLLAKGSQHHVRPLRLEQAWSLSHGDGQVIAILDTGVDSDHPDLAARLLPGRDLVNGDADPADDEGHGTAIAGMAAAATDNGTGIAGVAWGARILPVKVLDAEGRGLDSDIAAGIAWAADQGAHVINLSLGGWGGSPALDEAVAHARSRGAVVVAAAGNEGLVDPVYPAASPGAIAVSATDAGGEFAWFSNYGSWVDVAAPGWRSFSTAAAPGKLDAYRPVTGTSAAAAVVSGAAALLRASEPALGPDAIADRLLASATDHGPHGIDPYYGHGFLDPAAALGAPPRPPSALEPGDGNGTSARARVLAFSDIGLYDRIAQQGEVDWFAFDAPAAGQYWVRTTSLYNPAVYANALDLALELYGPDLQFLHRVDVFGTGSSESEVFHVPAPGRYYVRIDNFRGSRSPFGHIGRDSYEVEVTTTSGPVEPFLPSGPYDGRFPTWAHFGAAAIADVTGDGRSDVLLTTEHGEEGSPNDYKLLVHPQTQEGWLDSPQRIDPPGDHGPLRLAVGDVTGDGRTDAVVTAPAGILVYPQAGGGLGEPQLLAGTEGADLVEVADWDGDGRQDLVWTRANWVWDEDPGDEDGLFLQRNTTSGWERVALAADETREDLDVGDLDGDGRPDVAALQSRSASNLTVRIYRQRADGTVAAEMLDREWLAAVEVADVTGDGRDDLLTGSRYASTTVPGTLQVSAQDAAGGLGPPAGYGTGAVEAVEAGDFDGDGRADVITWLPSAGGIGLHLQTPSGTLGERAFQQTPYGTNRPDGLAAGDITGDGVADGIQNNSNYGLVPLRRRTPSWPAPAWVADATPSDHARGVSTRAAPTVRFGRAVDPASISADTVRLTDASSGTEVAATRSYDAARRTLTFTPAEPLVAGRPHVLTVGGVRDTAGRRMAANGTRSRVEDGGRYQVDGPVDEAFSLRFTVGTPPADTTPPETQIVSGLSASTPERGGRFLTLAHEQGVALECSYFGGAWTPCHPEASTPHFGSENPGTYSFRVRAVDAAGNADPTPAERIWTNDASIAYPPNDFDHEAVEIGGASGSVSVRTAPIRGGSASLWLSPANAGGNLVWYAWTAPASGRVTFDTSGSSFDTVLGVFHSSGRNENWIAGDDDAGDGAAARAEFDAVAGRRYLVALGGWLDGFSDEWNRDGYAPGGDAVLSWSQAAAPPDTTIDSGPPPLAASRSATFAFSSTTAGATFECRLDGGAFASCTSPATFTGLADGEHVLEVRATAGGASDPTPAEWRWRVDATAPETTIASGPPATTTQSEATFHMTASETPASFECRLDGGAWAPCHSPHTVSGLAAGEHALEARAIDAAGNADATPARHAWTVVPPPPPPGDDDPPETSIQAGPSGLVASRRAVFELAADEAGATFECALDGGAWAPCASPAVFDGLADGPHAFAARARDGAGNVDATPAERSWTVDATAPDTRITAGPPAETSSTDAQLEFAASEPASFRCALDGADASACSSPHELRGLAAGEHRFAVRAIDLAGNVEPEPAVHAWQVVAGTSGGSQGPATGGGSAGEPPTGGADPSAPAADTPFASLRDGYREWLRRALRELRTVRVGTSRRGRLRVLSCPDPAHSRFSRTALCRLPSRAVVTVRSSNGRRLLRARRSLQPGRVAKVWLRVPRRARPAARLRLTAPNGERVGVSWRLRVR